MEFLLVMSLIFQYTFLTAFGQKRLVSYLAVPYKTLHTVCIAQSHLDHDVRREDVLREEHPEDVVEEEAGEEQRRHLQRGQPHEGDERHAQAHPHRVHQQPVA